MCDNLVKIHVKAGPAKEVVFTGHDADWTRLPAPIQGFETEKLRACREYSFKSVAAYARKLAGLG
ncbi:MAG TPA: hypothetical protein VFB33_03480 [Candidatus Binataceae bacterium]|nr:hypothetical protein [Candidatus Binataceae bacterium]